MPDAETTATAAPPAIRSKKVVHWQEVQDTVSRLASHKGVLAISILNSDGDIVTQQITSEGASRNSSGGLGSGSASTGSKSVLGNPKLLTEMMKNANKYVESLVGHESSSSGGIGGETETIAGEEEKGSPSAAKPKEDISFVRIRTQRDEILVAPKLGYTLVVLQDPVLSSL